MVGKDYRLWVLIQQVVGVMQKAKRKELPYGVTVEEFAVLFVIQAAERPVKPSKISRWLCHEPNSVSVLLDRMKKRGLVVKFRDLKDRRAVRVILTEKGQRIFDQVKKEEDKGALASIFSSLSKNQRQQLESILGMLRERAFEELEIKWRPPFP